MEPSSIVQPADAPPAEPPRELSRAVRRRAWTEPRVRVWWMLALGVLLVTLYVVLTQIAAWWQERQLLKNGVVVQAVIIEAADRLNTISVPGKQMPPDSVCTMVFTLNGKEHQVRDQLPEHMERGIHVVTGRIDPVTRQPDNPVTLRVDPNNPDRWTDRTETPPLLSRQLIGVSIGTPIVLLTALLAWLGRRKAAEVWRSGVASPALVVGVGQTPIAPRSRVVRCTPADSHDNRVFNVYLPAGAQPVASGDVLWVVHPAHKAEPVYSVAWFEREQQT